jgi:CBS domain-containing protein
MEAITLKMVLDSKANKGDTIMVDESASLLSATRTMCDAKVGAVLVQNAKQEPVGILSERDILRFCAKNHLDFDRVKVSEVMTQDLIVGTLDSLVKDVQAIMTEKKFRHLPVVDGGKVIGLVSIGDLVRIQLEETDVEVQYLRNFINL